MTILHQQCQIVRDEQSDCCNIIGDCLCNEFQNAFDVCTEVCSLAIAYIGDEKVWY